MTKSEQFKAWLDAQDYDSDRLVLRPGMLVVRQKDMRVWQVRERTTHGVELINPIDLTETLTIEFGEPVELLGEFEKRASNKRNKRKG